MFSTPIGARPTHCIISIVFCNCRIGKLLCFRNLKVSVVKELLIRLTLKIGGADKKKSNGGTYSLSNRSLSPLSHSPDQSNQIK